MLLIQLFCLDQSFRLYKRTIILDRFNVIIPVLNKADIIVIFSYLFYDHSDFISQRIESLLLLQFNLKRQCHTYMILLYQFLKIFFTFLILTRKNFIADFKLLQFSYFFTDHFYVLLQALLVIKENIHILLINLQSFFQFINDQSVTKSNLLLFYKFYLTQVLHLCCLFCYIFIRRVMF